MVRVKWFGGSLCPPADSPPPLPISLAPRRQLGEVFTRIGRNGAVKWSGPVGGRLCVPHIPGKAGKPGGDREKESGANHLRLS